MAESCSVSSILLPFLLSYLLAPAFTISTEPSSVATSSTSQNKLETITHSTQLSGATSGVTSGVTESNHTTVDRNRTKTSNYTPASLSKGLSDNPGLVAVLCIFISVLCIALVVTAVRSCQKPNAKFEKLDEVAMNGMNEEAPFARSPPK
ncbi:putative LOC729966 homolog [Leptodactylus fuscus]|uniref:putative LOC729966 homolog n=1 Tax=Leptodactylus fuscus TaxID=238119 RepID=UPI003F4EA93A